MNENDFKDTLLKYIEEGFPKVEIELEGDRSVFFDAEKYNYRFLDSHFWFGGNGVNVNIDYRIIKAVVI